jgi:hypothetical protein
MLKTTYRILIAMMAFSKSSGKITLCLDLKKLKRKKKKLVWRKRRRKRF